ncbi:helix-turn-helix transcriptional regulator [Mycoplasma iguanae]|uniref:Helix-turn-helix transcriptional regulator n=1 Tax=Mycoplasma iguanae TaxID=292461 RepID=A0ABY5R8F0_9MOLU|nr:helix-turn-helix transcriptional regulator [Mycoplasma iguanae]UVD81556.1 helix-turn-helix transcriptional regulator [Mycoplasma iguanae]
MLVIINYPSAIKKLRSKLNCSQQDLAKMLGVAFTSVNRWENGHHQPTIIAKEKLKELFEKHNIEMEDKEIWN